MTTRALTTTSTPLTLSNTLLSSHLLSTLTLTSEDLSILTTLSTVTLSRLFDPTQDPSLGIAAIRCEELTRIQEWLVSHVFPTSPTLRRVDFSFLRVIDPSDADLDEQVESYAIVLDHTAPQTGDR